MTGDDFTFPNMKKLIVPKEFWNFEAVELPNDIYTGYKYFYNYSTSLFGDKVLKQSTENAEKTQNDGSKEPKETSKYGPIKGYDYKFQFMVDFIDCLKIQLSKYGMESSFDLGLMSVNEEYTKETLELFTQFRMGNLRQYMDENNGRGIMILYSIILHNLNSNFSNSRNNRLLFLHCCELAIATITKAWKGVFIY